MQACSYIVATELVRGDFMAAVLKTTDVRCRIEEDLKENATDILKACGLSISDAMRLFLRQVVAVQGLPFEVRMPSEKTARALSQAREIRGRFDSIDELFKDLDGQDAPKAGK
jgi:DNA-damage-inducible protein J